METALRNSLVHSVTEPYLFNALPVGSFSQAGCEGFVFRVIREGNLSE